QARFSSFVQVRGTVMATKLFVGSLSYNTTDATLEEFFASVGKVVSAKVIMDRDTNRSKGFGFVEMESDEEAKAAIDQLNGKELDGRTIAVNEARPQENRERRSFGGGDRGGNRGGGFNRDRGNRY
ncbi:MAG TPA: RNA-binding protein, partial [Candidatus Saccharimonadales bacterium]|nr:RNA-binding protein [Candidatus Saccharimonadales bacterium]